MVKYRLCHIQTEATIGSEAQRDPRCMMLSAPNVVVVARFLSCLMVGKKFFAVNVLRKSMEVQELQECLIREMIDRCLALPATSVAVVARFLLDPRVVSLFCAVTALPARRTVALLAPP